MITRDYDVLLLSVITALSFIFTLLIIGKFIFDVREKQLKQLTASGIWFTISLLLFTSVQVAVYLREVGLISTMDVYWIRLIQNLAWCIFGANFWCNKHLYKNGGNH